MDFKHFIIAASNHANNSSMRIGQSYMESLRFHRPDLYEQVVSWSMMGRAWDPDAENDDAKLPNLLGFLAEHWDDEEHDTNLSDVALVLGAIILEAGGEIRIKDNDLVRADGLIETYRDYGTQETVFKLRPKGIIQEELRSGR